MLYFLTAVFILLFSHVVLLPIIKKRPVIIKGAEGALFLFSPTLAGSYLFFANLFLIGLFIGLWLYFTKSWLIWGLSKDKVIAALERASQASRSSYVKEGPSYKVDNVTLVRVERVIVDNLIIASNNRKYSKKTQLTLDIFRKFLLNYFI